VQFSPEQRNLVVHAANEAEERTTRYYCIPPFRWNQLSYDLLTREDTGWEPLPEPVLARVQLLQKIRPEPLKPFDFYRIQLNDPSILHAAARENLEGNLYHFLVYILTHEMVHMVRLSSILEPDKAIPQVLETEEKRVQRISRQILSGANFRAFHTILEKFCFTHLISD
jgi:hypothetical protein